MHGRHLFGWIGLLLLTGWNARGQVRVPRLVGDGMVLQRDIPIRIWGFASPGEQVTVKFDGETASGVTDDNGRWLVIFSPKKAGGPYTMDIDGINHIWLKNIMVGEVWFCSGGSGMQLPMEKVKDTGLIARVERAPIRQYRITTRYDFKGPRLNFASGEWTHASSASSALACLFALRVYDQYHVAVGFIDATVADAPAEAWLSPEALASFPAFEAKGSRYADSSYAEGKGPADRAVPGGLFNGMVAPASIYTVRGVLWCQGEANISRPGEYHGVFATLIGDWRRHWGQTSLPWVYVQAGAHGALAAEPQESRWAELREAQRLTLSVPMTGMAVSADLGEGSDGEMQDIGEVAKRLFMSAESVAYGKANIIFTGPLFHSIHIRHEKVTIRFEEVESGLIVKGGGELHGFTLAGDDNHFYPAKADIEGKTVVVTCAQVPNPAAVRYGWADNPKGINLINRDQLFQDGLPASPFEARKPAK
ncbi:MAG TPA: sialate O-acetylesterase [Puia sp.]|jgi:sialate O-acetylesterase|nr:sialate O-acetylesterase [Puia sp.]